MPSLQLSLTVLREFIVRWFTNVTHIVEQETFWTAISACGTVLALYFIYRQIAVTSKLSAYEFLRREDERFHSATLRDARARLACELLRTEPQFSVVELLASPVLSYFEDLGLMLRKKIVPIDYLWTMECWYILRYWEALRPHIQRLREKDRDRTLYSEFEFLAAKIARYEETITGSAPQSSRDDLLQLLEEEAGITLRPASRRDIPALVEVENESFIEADAYSTQEFQELLNKHRDGLTIVELCGRVAGYVLSYDTNAVGEIDSIAVSPQCRRLRLANRLLDHAIASCRSRGAKSITLEVRPENIEAIALYSKHGFKKSPELLEKYYADGGSAYRMVLNLSANSIPDGDLQMVKDGTLTTTPLTR